MKSTETAAMAAQLWRSGTFSVSSIMAAMEMPHTHARSFALGLAVAQQMKAGDLGTLRFAFENFSQVPQNRESASVKVRIPVVVNSAGAWHALETYDDGFEPTMTEARDLVAGQVAARIAIVEADVDLPAAVRIDVVQGTVQP